MAHPDPYPTISRRLRQLSGSFGLGSAGARRMRSRPERSSQFADELLGVGSTASPYASIARTRLVRSTLVLDARGKEAWLMPADARLAAIRHKRIVHSTAKCAMNSCPVSSFKPLLGAPMARRSLPTRRKHCADFRDTTLDAAQRLGLWGTCAVVSSCGCD
jgi:hypothetical protein